MEKRSPTVEEDEDYLIEITHDIKDYIHAMLSMKSNWKGLSIIAQKLQPREVQINIEEVLRSELFKEAIKEIWSQSLWVH